MKTEGNQGAEYKNNANIVAPQPAAWWIKSSILFGLEESPKFVFMAPDWISDHPNRQNEWKHESGDPKKMFRFIFHTRFIFLPLQWPLSREEAMQFLPGSKRDRQRQLPFHYYYQSSA
jgi:hypothetical protein